MTATPAPEPTPDGAYIALVAPTLEIGLRERDHLPDDVRRHAMIVTDPSQLRGFYCCRVIVSTYPGPWPEKAEDALEYAHRRVQMYQSVVANEQRNMAASAEREMAEPTDPGHSLLRQLTAALHRETPTWTKAALAVAALLVLALFVYGLLVLLVFQP